MSDVAAFTNIATSQVEAKVATKACVTRVTIEASCQIKRTERALLILVEKRDVATRLTVCKILTFLAIENACVAGNTTGEVIIVVY